jgi:hypothetical protein
MDANGRTVKDSPNLYVQKLDKYLPMRGEGINQNHTTNNQ